MTSRTVTGRIPELDGLRGVAIAMVLTWHCVASNCGGAPKTFLYYVARIGGLNWSGVDLFFVLSGFLIGGILLDAKTSGNYYRTFYIRRCFRILPLYSLLSIVPLAFLFISPNLRGFAFTVIGHPLPWYISAVFGQNIWFAFKADWGNIYMSASWSLAVEEQFYLILPFIVRKVSVRTLASLSIVTILVAPFVRLLSYKFIGNLAPYTLVACRADALIIGVLAAIAVRRAGTSNIFGKHTHTMLAATASLLGVILLIFIKRGWGPGSMAMNTIGYSLLAVFYCCLLMLALAPRDTRFRALLRCSPLVKLGAVAYCAYLVHQPLMSISYYLLTGAPPRLHHLSDFGPLLVGFAAIFAVSELSRRYFEQPLIAVGHRFRYKHLSVAMHSAQAVSAVHSSL